MLAIKRIYGDNQLALPIDLGNSPAQDEIDSKLNYFRTSLAMASHLGIGNYADIEVSHAHFVDVFDFAVGKFKRFSESSLPDKQVITGTFWGLSLRLIFQASTIDAKTKLDVKTGPVAFAAAVELGQIALQYQVECVGASPRVMAAALRGVPVISKFDVAAYSRLSSALQNIISEMVATARKHPEQLLPIGVTLSRPPGGLLEEARSIRYAMGQLADGRKLRAAQELRPPWANASIVDLVYAEKLGAGAQGPVPAAAATAARQWLAII